MRRAWPNTTHATCGSLPDLRRKPGLPSVLAPQSRKAPQDGPPNRSRARNKYQPQDVAKPVSKGSVSTPAVATGPKSASLTPLCSHSHCMTPSSRSTRSCGAPRRRAMNHCTVAYTHRGRCLPGSQVGDVARYVGDPIANSDASMEDESGRSNTIHHHDDSQVEPWRA